MGIYRKIWVDAYGPIPKDDAGRSYEIHHINGDRTDNRLENLQCITVETHYRLHYERGDYGAAFRIAQRLDIPPQIKSELMSLSNKKRLEQGNHPFIDEEVRKKSRESISRNIEKGIQGLQRKDILEKAIQAKKDKFTGEELSKQVKLGWTRWKEANGDAKQRTLQGSKAGADRTRGTKWYYNEKGQHLRTVSDDPRLLQENWIQGRFPKKK